MAIFVTISLIPFPLQAQKRGLKSITAQNLKTHMLFLSSDELEGRNTGEPVLNIAAKYLAVQAEQLGLKAPDPEYGFFNRTLSRKGCMTGPIAMLPLKLPDGSCS